MPGFGGRVLLVGLGSAVFIAAVDRVNVPPARAFDAVANLVVSGSGASVSVSQGVQVLALPPEIVVIDQNTGERRVGPLWLARQRINDHSKERAKRAGSVSP